jgi:glucose/arabinose dehydrogenase
MPRIQWRVLILLLTVLGSTGAAQPQQPRRANPSAISVPSGYKVEPVVINLSVPTTIIFRDGDMIVAESGWVNTAKPRVLRISLDGSVNVLASEGLQGPVTGVLFVDGELYVSHKGRVSIIESGQITRDVLTGLPSDGDHQNNQIVIGPDRKIYMGQGTVTNSGVVGIDSYIFGWLDKHPRLAETPCQDITLVGENFVSENPLSRTRESVTTGAYKAFGTPSRAGEVIKGSPKCGGSVVRFAPNGSEFEVVAWGLRNPFGLKFDRAGQLWVTSHGADVRGSRNIFNDPDYMIRVQEGAWYGWPEYFAGEPATSPRFAAPTKPEPKYLWQHHPPLRRPDFLLDTHAGINGFAFSPGGAFGFDGDAFVAMFGAFVPMTTGVNIRPAGYNVVRVEMKTGRAHDFASNVLPGPSYINRTGGFDRPADVAFGPDHSLYVLDWGSSTVTNEGLKLVPQTGIVWRIYPATLPAVRATGPIVVEAASAAVPEAQRRPEIRNVLQFYKMVGPSVAIVIGAIVLAVIAVVVAARGRRRSR